MNLLKILLDLAVFSAGLFAFACGRPDIAAATFAALAALNSIKVTA